MQQKKVVLSVNSTILDRIYFEAQCKGVTPVQEMINTLSNKYAVDENAGPEAGWLNWILHFKGAPDFKPSP